jgi:hypothetical protein
VPTVADDQKPNDPAPKSTITIDGKGTTDIKGPIDVDLDIKLDPKELAELGIVSDVDDVQVITAVIADDDDDKDDDNDDPKSKKAKRKEVRIERRAIRTDGKEIKEDDKDKEKVSAEVEKARAELKAAQAQLAKAARHLAELEGGKAKDGRVEYRTPDGKIVILERRVGGPLELRVDGSTARLLNPGDAMSIRSRVVAPQPPRVVRVPATPGAGPNEARIIERIRPPANTERRIDELEKKLDRLIDEIKSLKKDRESNSSKRDASFDKGKSFVSAVGAIY